MISSTGVPPIANIKEILLAKSWSKMSQNQFKLVYSVWISDGQNYVFFTTFAKPKVVVYGSCTCPSFARVPVLCLLTYYAVTRVTLATSVTPTILGLRGEFTRVG